MLYFKCSFFCYVSSDLYQTTIKEIYSPFVVANKKEVNTIKNVKSLSASLFAEVKESK